MNKRRLKLKPKRLKMNAKLEKPVLKINWRKLLNSYRKNKRITKIRCAYKKKDWLNLGRKVSKKRRLGPKKSFNKPFAKKNRLQLNS